LGRWWWNRLVLVQTQGRHQIFDKIIAKVGEFWRSIDENKEPEPNFERDARFIASCTVKLIGKRPPLLPMKLRLLPPTTNYNPKEKRAKKQKESSKPKSYAPLVIPPGWLVAISLLQQARLNQRRSQLTRAKIQNLQNKFQGRKDDGE